MAAYDLERLSILIIDSSSFALALLSRVLRSLGVRKIVVANGGAEAVNILKNAGKINKLQPSATVQQFDVIFCEWRMSPINGAMMVKWIRRHKDSPDPFIPIIVASALSEADVAAEARDLGATEFLVKPFSVASLAAKLAGVIEWPRPFVYSRDFFGPDRRRAPQIVAFEERRMATDSSIMTLHQPKIPSVFKEGVMAYRFVLPNRIKTLVSGLGGMQEQGSFAEEAMESAHAGVVGMDADYSAWAMDLVNKLEKICHQLAKQPKNYWKYYALMTDVSHDLRGQGGTFGYPLISAIAKSLFEYARLNVSPDSAFVDLLHTHVQCVQSVLRDKVRGDGGDIGKGVLEMLDNARHHYENRTIDSSLKADAQEPLSDSGQDESLPDLDDNFEK